MVNGAWGTTKTTCNRLTGCSRGFFWWGGNQKLMPKIWCPKIGGNLIFVRQNGTRRALRVHVREVLSANTKPRYRSTTYKWNNYLRQTYRVYVFYMYICTCISMYIYIYICKYIYVCIYIYIYITYHAHISVAAHVLSMTQRLDITWCWPSAWWQSCLN